MISGHCAWVLSQCNAHQFNSNSSASIQLQLDSNFDQLFVALEIARILALTVKCHRWTKFILVYSIAFDKLIEIMCASVNCV